MCGQKAYFQGNNDASLCVMLIQGEKGVDAHGQALALPINQSGPVRGKEVGGSLPSRRLHPFVTALGLGF